MSADCGKKRSRRSRSEHEQEQERQQEPVDNTPQQAQESQQKESRRDRQHKRDQIEPQTQRPTASAASLPQPAVSSPQSDIEKKKKRRRKRARRDSAAEASTAAASAASTAASAPLPYVPAGCFRAFVGGLPYNVSEAELTAFFQRDGCFVWSVRIAQYRQGHQFEKQQRGFAHVEFENESQVARSLQHNGALWSDGEHRITVQIANPKRSDSTASEAAAVSV